MIPSRTLKCDPEVRGKLSIIPTVLPSPEATTSLIFSKNGLRKCVNRLGMAYYIELESFRLEQLSTFSLTVIEGRTSSSLFRRPQLGLGLRA